MGVSEMSSRRVDGRPQLAPLLDWFERQPLAAAVALFVVDFVLAFAFGLAAKALLPQFDPAFVALVAMSLVIAAILTALGWWRVAGFNAPAQWRELNLLWLPVLVVVVLPFVSGAQAADASALYLIVAYALTGFMEEAWMRGLVLGVLGPLGPARAVYISSILFGLLHAGNVLYRNPAIVVAQMIGAMADGVAFGALRLRTNTIWAPIFVHGIHDLLLNYTRLPRIPLNVVQDVILFFYGLYLLRALRARPAAAPAP